MQDAKVFFITGASKGFGLELTRQLLAAGHSVAATSRSKAGLIAAAGTPTPAFLPLEMDLTDESSIGQAVAEAIGAFGSLDVIINNAGYGQLGGLEELSDTETRKNYAVNVFGTQNVIRAVLPQLRAQGSGHIINISSIAGITGGFPGWGVYCGTKFAVEGLSESLAAEVAEFGIKVTVVAPGYFRTEFLDNGSLGLPEHPISAYVAIRESESAHTSHLQGNQPGDPVKGAAAIIRIAGTEHPPLHLLLGPDAYAMAEKKLADLKKEMEAWKELSLSTDLETA
ncbi:short-subunit dehydrogenase [Neolewinella xylanilytica]|uniref:Short-subunit dehydrogenase n=1 Tax=Neolewinella xylanilytica TaxID=1514080 RepID=A0A2S6I6J1_9BACT|nr:oxidoreductase [Neolewinella xylanilytica]PPK87108.1 short-subunit dehydrogenase [Neolewinella xylanilytica]